MCESETRPTALNSMIMIWEEHCYHSLVLELLPTVGNPRWSFGEPIKTTITYMHVIFR